MAYRDFFNTDEAWPENDEWSEFQPQYDYLVACALVDLYFDSKRGKVTEEGVKFLTDILPVIDQEYGISLSSIPGKSAQGIAVQPPGAHEMKKIYEVALAIDFLMNMEPYDMVHCMEDNERSQDHSHAWALANLIDGACENSLSYIGPEAYNSCLIATLIAIGAINPRPEDVVKIISIAPRVLEVLDINQNQ
jgi:hypothetical protein